MVTANRGYTLIEMMVVISVMGIIGTIAFFGMSSARENEKLNTAQKELVSHLRSRQNNALAGANNGITENFTLVTYRPQLPAGIEMSDPGTICFFNPNRDPAVCGTCPDSWICPVSIPNSVTITLTNTKTNLTKQVKIDGSGIKINQITGL